MMRHLCCLLLQLVLLSLWVAAATAGEFVEMEHRHHDGATLVDAGGEEEDVMDEGEDHWYPRGGRGARP